MAFSRKEGPVNTEQDNEKTDGEKISFAERLLQLFLLPFKLIIKLFFKLIKMFIKSIILAPFTIVIWLGVIAVVVMLLLGII